MRLKSRIRSLERRGREPRQPTALVYWETASPALLTVMDRLVDPVGHLAPSGPGPHPPGASLFRYLENRKALKRGQKAPETDKISRSRSPARSGGPSSNSV